jgi:hypothetical protein
MSIEDILADLEAAEIRLKEARAAITSGDRMGAIHACRRIGYNGMIAAQSLRTFSDQAFPAATAHIRAKGGAV